MSKSLSPRWKKSTSSANLGCVEVRLTEGSVIEVRDSKNRSGPVLSFNRTEWIEFLNGVERGEFDV
jgi:hypothetical protein